LHQNSLPDPSERLVAASLPAVEGALFAWLTTWGRRADAAARPFAWRYLYKSIWLKEVSEAALRLIMRSFTGETVILARLACRIGRAVEGELKARPPEPWTDATHFRVGMALIEVVVNATEWFAVGVGSHDRSRQRYSPPLVLAMQPTVAEWFGNETAASLSGEAPAANTPDLMPASGAMAGSRIVSPSFYRNRASPRADAKRLTP
jgi:hypothetical protein